jgi:integrase
MQDQQGSQAAEIQRPLTCDVLEKNVTPLSGGWAGETASLHGLTGARKYLNHSERNRALAAMQRLDPHYELYALVLAWTGARVSEILALTSSSFQIESGIVTIVTLKRRKHSVREIPLPPGLMRSLDRFYCLRGLQQERNAPQRLWAFCRMTAWRIIKRVMRLARIVGPAACPRGLRHGFGVGSLQSGVPVTLVQRWMGHARLSTTSIYLNVCGPEEIAFARRFWRTKQIPSADTIRLRQRFAACHLSPQKTYPAL